MEQVRVENSKSDYHEGLIEIYKHTRLVTNKHIYKVSSGMHIISVQEQWTGGIVYLHFDMTFTQKENASYANCLVAASQVISFYLHIPFLILPSND